MADTAEPFEAVRHYIDCFNKGDIEGMAAACADPMSILMGRPWHVNVTSDRAYVAVPTTMSFMVRGQQVKQSGSVFTVALRKFEAGWCLTAWAWAKGTQVDVIEKENP